MADLNASAGNQDAVLDGNRAALVGVLAKNTINVSKASPIIVGI